MRIALINGGVTTWLAGNPAVPEREFSSAGELIIEPQNLVQTNNFIRAIQAKHEDRKNIDTNVSWTTKRTFATRAAANLFALDYDRSTSRIGTLQFNDGTNIRYLANAVVMPPRRQIIGVTVMLNYTARGGQITNVNPDA